jgi:excisionase family DNA binding protein
VVICYVGLRKKAVRVGNNIELIQGKNGDGNDAKFEQDGLRVDRKLDTGVIEKTIFDNLKWLTSREATEYLRLPSVGALRQLVYRRRIPFSKMGRSLRFNRRELDRFLEISTYPKRRNA